MPADALTWQETASTRRDTPGEFRADQQIHAGIGDLLDHPGDREVPFGQHQDARSYRKPGQVAVRTAENTGLTRGLSTWLSLLRKPGARHDPGKVMTDLAVMMLALGGDCVSDLALLRGEPGVFGVVVACGTRTVVDIVFGPLRIAETAYAPRLAGVSARRVK